MTVRSARPSPLAPLTIRQLRFAGGPRFILRTLLYRLRQQRGHDQGSRVAIVTHYLNLGPSNHVESYLAERTAATVLAIDHQLVHSRPAVSTYRVHREGKPVSEGQLRVTAPEPVRFIIDTLLTLYWCTRKLGRCDLYIGANPLNALAGVVLRLLGRTRTVVYYSIDWVPRRFNGRFMNSTYRLVEHAVALAATETWNLSDAMHQARWSSPPWRWIRRFADARARTLPIGVTMLQQNDEPVRSNAHQLAFMGHLIEKQGLQYVIEALPSLLRDFPDIQLEVVGRGPYAEDLTRQAEKLGVAKRVTFHGYVDDEIDVLKILASSAIGLAPYVEDEESFTRYADPGKIKTYLAAGLPVVTTSVPPQAKELADAGCAVVVEASTEGVTKGVRALLSEDDTARARRREMSREYVRPLEWTRLFDEAAIVGRFLE